MKNKSSTSFWGHVTKITTGTALGQICAIIAIPIISRLYEPDEIGVLNIVKSIAGVIAIIGSLRLERAIILVDENDRVRLFFVCIYILCIITSISAVVIWVNGEIFSDWFDLPQTILPFIPVLILFSGLFNIFTSLSNSYLLYVSISLSLVITSFIGYFLKVFNGYIFETNYLGLLFAEIAGIFCSLLILMLGLRKKIGNWFKNLPSLEFSKKILKQEREFLKYDNLTSLLNNFSWLMPVFFLSVYFNNAIVGYYAFGFTLLRLPMNLLGKAIGNVFYKSSSMKKNNEEIAEESLNVIQKLFFFGSLPTVLIGLFGKEIFTLFLGAEWGEVRVFSQILSFWSLVWLISSPISNLFYTLRLQKSFLIFMVVSVLLRALAFILGGELGNVYWTLISFSISSVIIYGYQIIYLFSKLDVSSKTLWKKVSTESISIGWPIAVMVLLVFLEISIVFKLAISVVVILFVYALEILAERKNIGLNEG